MFLPPLWTCSGAMSSLHSSLVSSYPGLGLVSSGGLSPMFMATTFLRTSTTQPLFLAFLQTRILRQPSCSARKLSILLGMVPARLLKNVQKESLFSVYRVLWGFSYRLSWPGWSLPSWQDLNVEPAPW